MGRKRAFLKGKGFSQEQGEGLRARPGNHRRHRIIVTTDMHERKRLMFERADAFVALPGGIGTLEELVEQLTWRQLDRHRNPILLASLNGFWKPLLLLFAHMRELHFIRPGLEAPYIVAEKIADVLPMLEQDAARRRGLTAAPFTPFTPRAGQAYAIWHMRAVYSSVLRLFPDIAALRWPGVGVHRRGGIEHAYCEGFSCCRFRLGAVCPSGAGANRAGGGKGGGEHGEKAGRHNR